VANVHEKFEVSSFNRFRDMEGLPKFQKVGHVTPSVLISFVVHCDISQS